MDAFLSSQRFQPYLFAGERVLWTGQPKQGLAFRQSDLLAVPFSLLWGGFAIFWNIGVWTFPKTGENIDWFMRLWGLPFLAIGLYLIVGRFFWHAWVRSHLYYAVTNQRVLILRTDFSSKLVARNIEALPMLQLTEHRDGTATITFDSDDVGYSWWGRNRNFGIWSPSTGETTQFFRIDNPRRIYELIRNQAYG